MRHHSPPRNAEIKMYGTIPSLNHVFSQYSAIITYVGSHVYEAETTVLVCTNIHLTQVCFGSIYNRTATCCLSLYHVSCYLQDEPS